DQRQVDNCIGLIISSNSDLNALPLDLLKRRVFITSVNPNPMSSAYFSKLAALKKNRDFLRALDHYFQRRATRPGFSRFDVRKRPLTEGFRAAVRFQQEGVRRWLDVISQAHNIYTATNAMTHRDSTSWRAEGPMNYRYNYDANRNDR